MPVKKYITKRTIKIALEVVAVAALCLGLNKAKGVYTAIHKLDAATEVVLGDFIIENSEDEFDVGDGKNLMDASRFLSECSYMEDDSSSTVGCYGRLVAVEGNDLVLHFAAKSEEDDTMLKVQCCGSNFELKLSNDKLSVYEINLMGMGDSVGDMLFTTAGDSQETIADVYLTDFGNEGR